MNCDNCGESLRADSKFCNNCGAKIETGGASNAFETASTSAESTTNGNPISYANPQANSNIDPYANPQANGNPNPYQAPNTFVPPYGQPPYGQSGQPPYAPYGQAPYGQPGQPPYAPYGQAPYGQPSSLFSQQDFNNLTGTGEQKASVSPIVFGIVGFFLVLLNLLIPIVHLIGLGFGVGAITTASRHSKLKYKYTIVGKILGIIDIAFAIFFIVLGIVFQAISGSPLFDLII